MEVNINDIHFRSNVRKEIDVTSDSFQHFKEDIHKNNLLNPLTVYKDPKTGNFILIAGHRRLEALKELNVETAPIHILDAPNGNFSAIQLSENVYRKDLTLLEEVLAFQSMINEKSTIKEIAEKFGSNQSYVKKRLQLANLHPRLLISPIFESSEFDLKEFLTLSTNDLSVQEDALRYGVNDTNKRKKKKININMYLKRWADGKASGYGSTCTNFLDYPGLNGNKVSKETLIDICGGEDLFIQLQKEHGNKKQKSLELFSEFIEDYNGDLDFVRYAAEQSTNKVFASNYQLLKELKVDTSLEQWDANVRSVCFSDMVRLKKGYIKNNVVSWTGFKERAIFSIKSTNSTSSKPETKERGKYYLQTKKFAKATVPSYVNYLFNMFLIKQNKTVDESALSKYLNRVVELKDISVGYYALGWNLTRILDDNMYNDWVVQPITIAKKIEFTLVQEALFRSSIKDLNKFAKIVNTISFKEHCLNIYNDSEEHREEMLRAFSISNLQNKFKQTGRKTDIIQYAVDNKLDFPFKDVFNSTEHEWKDLQVKSAYLSKEEIYSKDK